MFNDFFEFVLSKRMDINFNHNDQLISEDPMISAALSIIPIPPPIYQKPNTDYFLTLTPDEFKPILDWIKADTKLLEWLKKQDDTMFSDEMIDCILDCDKPSEWLLEKGKDPLTYQQVRDMVFNRLSDLWEVEARKQNASKQGERLPMTTRQLYNDLNNRLLENKKISLRTFQNTVKKLVSDQLITLDDGKYTYHSSKTERILSIISRKK